MAGKQSNFEKRVNEYARVTFLTEDGKPKSAVWLYAFLLSILFALVYLAIYLVSGFLLGKVWPDGAAVAILIQYAVTAAIGSGLCLLSCLLLRGPRRCFVYYAYFWLLVLLGMMVITSLFMCDWAGGTGWFDFWMFCIVVFFPSLLSILAGGFAARALWRREQLRQQKAEEENAVQRPSYYNT